MSVMSEPFVCSRCAPKLVRPTSGLWGAKHTSCAEASPPKRSILSVQWTAPHLRTPRQDGTSPGSIPLLLVASCSVRSTARSPGKKRPIAPFVAMRAPKTANMVRIRIRCHHLWREATRNKCIATSNKCLTTRSKKLLGAPGLTSSNKKPLVNVSSPTVARTVDTDRPNRPKARVTARRKRKRCTRRSVASRPWGCVGHGHIDAPSTSRLAMLGRKTLSLVNFAI